MRAYLISDFKLMTIYADKMDAEGFCKCEDCGIEHRKDTERFYDIKFAGNKWRRLCTRCTLATIFENNTVSEIISRFEDDGLKEADYDG